MLSCAGLSAGVEPGEGEALNGETDGKGCEGGENKGEKREEQERGREKERTRRA